jgi:hypothetical protein
MDSAADTGRRMKIPEGGLISIESFGGLGGPGHAERRLFGTQRPV